MASPIELELARRVCAMVPNADMVRFMKTGEDANSCNVRIARAFTKRDMILISGYHGYPDWFAADESPPTASRSSCGNTSGHSLGKL